MYTTQTDLSSRSSPEEIVNISLTKAQWDRLTSNVNATGMERERVMPIVDKIRIEAKLHPRQGVEYKLNIYA